MTWLHEKELTFDKEWEMWQVWIAHYWQPFLKCIEMHTMSKQMVSCGIASKVDTKVHVDDKSENTIVEFEAEEHYSYPSPTHNTTWNKGLAKCCLLMRLVSICLQLLRMVGTVGVYCPRFYRCTWRTCHECCNHFNQVVAMNRVGDRIQCIGSMDSSQQQCWCKYWRHWQTISNRTCCPLSVGVPRRMRALQLIY